MGSMEQVMASVEFLNQAANKLEDNHGQVSTTNVRLFAEAVPLTTSSWRGDAARMGAQVVTNLQNNARTLEQQLAAIFPAVRQAATSFAGQEADSVVALQQTPGSGIGMTINQPPSGN